MHNQLLEDFNTLVPEEVRQDDITPENQQRLIKTLISVCANQREHLDSQREHLESLTAALAEATTSAEDVGPAILSVNEWSRLRSLQQVSRAESFLNTHFRRVLESRGNPQAPGLLSNVVSLMTLCVSMPAVLEQPSFKNAARATMTELVVAKAGVEGVKPGRLASLRASLRDASLPEEIRKAYEHARLVDKLTDDASHHNHAKRFPRPSAGKRTSHDNNKANKL